MASAQHGRPRARTVRAFQRAQRHRAGRGRAQDSGVQPVPRRVHNCGDVAVQSRDLAGGEPGGRAPTGWDERPLPGVQHALPGTARHGFRLHPGLADHGFRLPRSRDFTTRDP